MKKILAVLLMAVISVGLPLDATSADAVDTFDTCDTSTRNYCEALIRGRDPIKLERCTGNFDFSVSKQDQLLRCYKLEQTNNGGEQESKAGNTVSGLKIFFMGVAAVLVVKFLWRMWVPLNDRMRHNGNIGLPHHQPGFTLEHAVQFVRTQMRQQDGYLPIDRLRALLRGNLGEPIVAFMRERADEVLQHFKAHGVVRFNVGTLF